MIHDPDYEELMRAALAEAEKAFAEDEIPVGAIVVLNGKIISCEHNMVESMKDPSAHAEILALRKAASILGAPNLSGAELIVTLEPCAMCAGALIASKITRLIFGCRNEKYGAVVTNISLFDIPAFNHHPEYKYPILEKECSEILSKYFRKKRKQTKPS